MFSHNLPPRPSLDEDFDWEFAIRCSVCECFRLPPGIYVAEESTPVLVHIRGLRFGITLKRLSICTRKNTQREKERAREREPGDIWWRENNLICFLAEKCLELATSNHQLEGKQLGWE